MVLLLMIKNISNLRQISWYQNLMYFFKYITDPYRDEIFLSYSCDWHLAEITLKLESDDVPLLIFQSDSSDIECLFLCLVIAYYETWKFLVVTDNYFSPNDRLVGQLNTWNFFNRIHQICNIFYSGFHPSDIFLAYLKIQYPPSHQKALFIIILILAFVSIRKFLLLWYEVVFHKFCISIGSNYTFVIRYVRDKTMGKKHVLVVIS